MLPSAVGDEQLDDLLRSLPESQETLDRVVDAIFSLPQHSAEMHTDDLAGTPASEQVCTISSSGSSVASALASMRVKWRILGLMWLQTHIDADSVNPQQSYTLTALWKVFGKESSLKSVAWSLKLIAWPPSACVNLCLPSWCLWNTNICSSHECQQSKCMRRGIPLAVLSTVWVAGMLSIQYTAYSLWMQRLWYRRLQ